MMRFSAEDIANLLYAVRVINDPDNYGRHSVDWATEFLGGKVPDLIDAYCVATGIELPVGK